MKEDPLRDLKWVLQNFSISSNELVNLSIL